MIEHDQAQTSMAREIRVIPFTIEGLLAQHRFVTTVANRIRAARAGGP
jgi:hypothetical protein